MECFFIYLIYFYVIICRFSYFLYGFSFIQFFFCFIFFYLELVYHTHFSFCTFFFFFKKCLYIYVVPGAVINLVGMPATSDGRPAVTLSWVKPDSDAPILQYTVRYGVGNSEPLSERTVSNLSLLVTDLELATEYYFSVYASSELGNGSINNFTVVTTFNGMRLDCNNSMYMQVKCIISFVCSSWSRNQFRCNSWSGIY